ncbi:MAG: hypothetical protein WCX77_00720 [Candidatus Paceibacterota bacterium]|jgi:hypothetical protein
MEAKNIIKLSVFFALFIVLAPVSIKASAPSAITDLYCAFSGTPGSIWLSWTVPAGSPTGYEVKYSLSGISDGDYNYAPAYSQSWSGSAAQGLVENLAQNKNWFFVMKAVNSDGTSSISNAVSCQPNNPATSTTLATVPSSSLSNLQAGAEVPAEKNYIIKGSSSDIGGSSIQKVELSLDGGATWQKTVAVKQVGTGFEWQYNWLAPKAGDYLIKTKAIDWLGAQENSSSSLSVKVAVEQSSSQTAATTTVQAATTTSQSTSTASQDDQQKRNLLIQIIQILLQILSRR